MKSINAYAAHSKSETLKPFTYETKPLLPKEVFVRVTHCGICHSDVHLIDNDWGTSGYPLVPGHEIVGIVEELGSAVVGLKKGSRVGIGWQAGACLECKECIAGKDNLCENSTATCVGHFGGFGEAVVVDSRFAFLIPETLSSENAAPLLCGGITVYSPLVAHKVTGSMKVGVIGIGGLGHLAVQFASKMGCDVTAFSTSDDKEALALKLGANRFVNSSDPKQMKALEGQFDFILATVSADIAWMDYIDALAYDGKLCVVGAAPTPIAIPAFALIRGRKTLCGSVIGSRNEIQSMLEFSARHGVQAMTQVKPMAEVNDALEMVRKNKARFRMVLEVKASR